MPPHPSPPPQASGHTRRAVLAVSVALPVAAGCAAAEPSPEARADLPVLAGAIAAERALVALYEAATRSGTLTGRSAATAADALAHHREHLSVLQRLYVPGSGHRADEGGVPAPGAPPNLPSDRSAVLRTLRAAENRAAAARGAEAGRAAPGLAQLLASIGACEAGHAAALA